LQPRPQVHAKIIRVLGSFGMNFTGGITNAARARARARNLVLFCS
jgi:hypothetical protein